MQVNQTEFTVNPEEIDKISVKLMECVGGFGGVRQPVKTLGDHNCCFNAICIAAFGNIENSLELRYRCLIEGLINYNLYRNKYDNLQNHGDLDESLKICAREGIWGNAWCLAFAATVLNITIVGKYPMFNGLYDRTFFDLNRNYSPIFNQGQVAKEIHILWTNSVYVNPIKTRRQMQLRGQNYHWFPGSFCSIVTS